VLSSCAVRDLFSTVASIVVRLRRSKSPGEINTLCHRPHLNDLEVYKCVVLGNEYGLPVAFQPGAVVVDIGGHIGCFTIACMQRGAARAIVAEAEAENHEYLLKNIKPYGDRVVALHKAVWRSDRPDGEVLFHTGYTDGGTNSGGGRVFEKVGQPVHTVGLDTLLRDLDEVEVLKIDCEGSEFPILYTSRLLDRVRRIVGEYHHVFRNPRFYEGVPESAKVEGFDSYRISELNSYLAGFGFSNRLPSFDDTLLGRFDFVRGR